MTTQKTKAVKPAGDSLIGLGGVAAIIGMALAVVTAGANGALTLILSLTLGGLLLVVIGCLKRIIQILENRQ